MTIDKKEPKTCVKQNSQNIWIVGIAAVGLAAFFCFALFSQKEKVKAVEDVAQDIMVIGAQQAAFIPPGCATCPTVTNCFPGATGTGSAQQIALMNPNCATCPNVARCFPQGANTNPAQQIAFQQSITADAPAAPTANVTKVICPICKITYSDPEAGKNGFSRCPRCGRILSVNTNNPNANSGPPIFRDALMPHPYRGVCEICHLVKPDIMIAINAQMPHVYRGVCSNCHTIQTQNGVIK